MHTNTAIEATDLSKCYRVFRSPRSRLLQGLWPGKRKFYEPFWALKDVSFRLEKGRTLGVVGRNGSGKSTLLQLLCGTLTPTSGSMNCYGRVAALLELGSGFNPEFTGLENVFLNAALLGLSDQETHERLDAILSFADIGDFVQQPVKTYSSGMALRLAFAVQANIEPDVLVVDEALAVGDEYFQRKCFNHIRQLRERGTAILLVSHSCPQIIQHCDEALLLDHGQLLLHDTPKRVVTAYQQLSSSRGNGAWDVEEAKAVRPHTTVRYPENGGAITGLEILNEMGQQLRLCKKGEEFQLRLHYRLDQPLDSLELKQLHAGCNLATQDGVQITGQRWDPTAEELKRVGETKIFSLCFRFRGGLIAGTYFISAGLWCGEDRRFIHRIVDVATLKVVEQNQSTTFGLCDLSSGTPVLSVNPD
jgi:lipopolysaccharide transport system ATP-binding protein